jgi:hypothetical protein
VRELFLWAVPFWEWGNRGGNIEVIELIFSFPPNALETLAANV